MNSQVSTIMDEKSRSQLGLLLTDQDKLLDILAQNPSALEDYPELQTHILEKNKKSVEYRRAIRNKEITKDEYIEAILDRIDWIGFELCMTLNLDFLVNKVASQVGSDIEAIKSLEIKGFGNDTLSKLLHLMGNAIYTTQDNKPSYPWLSVRGHANPAFWRKAHLAYDAFQDGYSSHFKLNEYFKFKYGIAVPQSFTRFVRQEGDPREIESWREFAGYVDRCSSR